MFTHFLELKIRLKYLILMVCLTFFISFYYSQEFLYFFIKPLIKSEIKHYFIFTNLIEVFMIYFYVSFFISFYITVPFIFLQIWLFLIPGLYKKEIKVLTLCFLLIILCFLIGFFLSYKILIPIICNFFLSFEITEYNSFFNIFFEAKINEYLELIFKLLNFLGLIFLIPLFFMILIYLNIIKYDWLVQNRKFYYLLLIILGAIFSPPDILSQLFIAMPNIIFFEIILFLINFIFEYSKIIAK